MMSPTIYVLKYTVLSLCLLFYMGVKHGFSYYESNIGWGNENRVLREILGPKEEKEVEAGKTA